MRNKHMRTKFSPIGRAHRLPKIEKKFLKVPFVRLIANTTNTSHYILAKFLRNYLNPPTQN